MRHLLAFRNRGACGLPRVLLLQVAHVQTVILRDCQRSSIIAAACAAFPAAWRPRIAGSVSEFRPSAGVSGSSAPIDLPLVRRAGAWRAADPAAPQETFNDAAGYTVAPPLPRQRSAVARYGAARPSSDATWIAET